MRNTSGSWAQPINAQKAHFFEGARSLCGKWAYASTLASVSGDSTGVHEVAAKPRADECVKCHRIARKVGSR